MYLESIKILRNRKKAGSTEKQTTAFLIILSFLNKKLLRA